MNFKTYPPKDGYTAEEIKKGLHWIDTDVVCPFCNYNQAVCNTKYVGGPCMRCGKLTSGKEE